MRPKYSPIKQQKFPKKAGLLFPGIVLIVSIILLTSSCESDLPKYQVRQGTAPVLSVSETGIVLTAGDSAETVLSLTWTDPDYFPEGTDVSVVGTYFLEISKDEQFSDFLSVSLGNKLDTSFTCYVLNSKLLSLELEANVSNNVFLRVKSAFFSKDTLSSNICTLAVTPYSISETAIAVPGALYITGDAIPAGWITPFPDNQKFTKSGTTFTLTTDLLGGKEYELITDVNGSNWTPCYRLAPDVNQSDMIWGGSFVWDGEGSDYNWTTQKFKTPDEDATYTLVFDFQDAIFSVVNEDVDPVIAVPDELYITGSAIPTGWSTPFPDEQKFTKTGNVFALTIDLLGDREYELITDVNGANWTPCYRLAPDADQSAMTWGGSFVWDGEGSDYGWSSQLFLTPSYDGTYQLIFNFQNATFSVRSED